MFGHVQSMYRSSPFHSTLNTGYITGLGMCKVCTEPLKRRKVHENIRPNINTPPKTTFEWTYIPIVSMYSIFTHIYLLIYHKSQAFMGLVYRCYGIWTFYQKFLWNHRCLLAELAGFFSASETILWLWLHWMGLGGVYLRVRGYVDIISQTIHVIMVYFPTFTIKNQPNAGKYTIHGWYGY